jgi:hypothetical protein
MNNSWNWPSKTNLSNNKIQNSKAMPDSSKITTSGLKINSWKASGDEISIRPSNTTIIKKKAQSHKARDNYFLPQNNSPKIYNIKTFKILGPYSRWLQNPFSPTNDSLTKGRIEISVLDLLLISPLTKPTISVRSIKTPLSRLSLIQNISIITKSGKCTLALFSLHYPIYQVQSTLKLIKLSKTFQNHANVWTILSLSFIMSKLPFLKINNFIEVLKIHKKKFTTKKPQKKWSVLNVLNRCKSIKVCPKTQRNQAKASKRGTKALKSQIVPQGKDVLLAIK